MSDQPAPSNTEQLRLLALIDAIWPALDRGSSEEARLAACTALDDLEAELKIEYDAAELAASRAEAEQLREALTWALRRVAMPGCRCSTGSDGPCTCNRESWPEYIQLRKAQALAEAAPEETP